MSALALVPMRRQALEALIAEKAHAHPELARALTLRTLKLILERERIRCYVRPSPIPARLVPFAGAWAIVLDKGMSDPERLLCAIHELAHLWAHHDVLLERWETEAVDRSDREWSLIQEAEADYVTELLVRGPSKPRATTYIQHLVRGADARGDSKRICPGCHAPIGNAPGQLRPAPRSRLCVRCVLEIDPPMMAGD